MIDYDDLREKATNATTGPWTTREDCYCRPSKRPDFFRVDDSEGLIIATTAYDRQSGSNAEYIAAASPDVVLELLNDIERLDALLVNRNAVFSAREELAEKASDEYKKERDLANTEAKRWKTAYDETVALMGESNDSLVRRLREAEAEARTYWIALKSVGDTIEQVRDDLAEALAAIARVKDYADGVEGFEVVHHSGTRLASDIRDVLRGDV